MGGHLHGGLSAAGGSFDLAAFLVLGLLGSTAHCVGMCAPFVLLVSRRYGTQPGGRPPLVAQLWYSAGRLVTYAALGAAAGAAGGVVQVAGTLVGLQRGAALLAGTMLVVSAVVSLVPGLSTRVSSGPFARVLSQLHGHIPRHPLTMGLMLGLLPCGLLYTALLGAMAGGGAAAGAAALTAFGLGTVPALIGLSLADTLLVRPRLTLNRLAHLFVLAMGVWFLWRGFGVPTLP